MVQCNYVLTPTLKSFLALPSASAAATVSPALLTSTSVVIVAVVLVVHLMPLLQYPLPASGRRGWRVVLALAAVDPREVNKAAFYLQLTHNTILRTLYCDEHDAVALHVPLTMHLHTIWCGIVEFIDSDGDSCTLPLQECHLWSSLVKSVLGVDCLPLHLLHRVIPGDDTSAAIVVVAFHYFFEDHLIKQLHTDCADKQDQAAIFGHSHLILTVFRCPFIWNTTSA